MTTHLALSCSSMSLQLSAQGHLQMTSYIVGKVTATDADVDVGNVITYSIESNPNFGIDSESGEVTVKDYVHAAEGGQFEVPVMECLMTQLWYASQ